MSETPAVNEPGSRSPTGEILDQNSTTPPTPPSSSTPPETPPKAPEPSTEPPPKEGETILGKDAKAPSAGAPEKYEDFKLPDGITLAGDQLTAATELFKTLNLDQAAAQKLVDFHAGQLKSLAEAPLAEYEAMRSEWKTKSNADPDIGPKAAAIRETLGRAFDALGDAPLVAEFKSAMNLTGVGDHPAFIKVMAKMAEKFVEGRHVTGQKPSPNGQQAPDAKPASVASALYPNLPA